ncbi:helix-turn-helix domain-containing protein [Amycolatopsis sp. cmx-4-54]|uniref:helix-turn-helix domain-containing protein n=1 Tax=Amycolatopsis sp. cmx-4-54 TaxID=2790936 RepID=UPI00397D0409
MTNRPSIRVRGDFAAKAAEQGHSTYSAIADAIGVDQSNVGRVLRGTSRPSNEFIAGAVRALGSFEDLFEVR